MYSSAAHGEVQGKTQVVVTLFFATEGYQPHCWQFAFTISAWSVAYTWAATIDAFAHSTKGVSAVNPYAVHEVCSHATASLSRQDTKQTIVFCGDSQPNRLSKRSGVRTLKSEMWDVTDLLDTSGDRFACCWLYDFKILTCNTWLTNLRFVKQSKVTEVISFTKEAMLQMCYPDISPYDKSWHLLRSRA